MSNDWFVAKRAREQITFDDAVRRGWTMQEYLLHLGHKEEDIYSGADAEERVDRFLRQMLNTPPERKRAR